MGSGITADPVNHNQGPSVLPVRAPELHVTWLKFTDQKHPPAKLVEELVAANAPIPPRVPSDALTWSTIPCANAMSPHHG